MIKTAIKAVRPSGRVDMVKAGTAMPKISPALNCSGTPQASKKAYAATRNATIQSTDPSPSINQARVSGAITKPIVTAAIISACSAEIAKLSPRFTFRAWR